jgi:hypothetical protein
VRCPASRKHFSYSVNFIKDVETARVNAKSRTLPLPCAANSTQAALRALKGCSFHAAPKLCSAAAACARVLESPLLEAA